MLGSIRRPEEEEVFGVKDWAEVHRLDRQGVPRRAIARRLGMSPTTVHRLLGLAEPPRYRRRRASSLLDPLASEIAAMLDVDAKVPATVVLQHLRRDGYVGGITILKEHLARVRPQFLAARTFQRTSYLPGEISQIDWWHTGREIPVGKGAHREAFALVATLPHSAAHAAVFTFG
jgi:transposase